MKRALSLALLLCVCSCTDKTANTAAATAPVTTPGATSPPTQGRVDEEKAKALLVAVYSALAPDTPDSPDLLARGALAKPLAAAWRKARTPNADGEVVLDWMPEVEGQDHGVSELSLATARDGAKLVVTARFNNLGTATTIAYDFVDEAGEPRIADVHAGVASRPSLLAFLEKANAAP